MGIFQDIQSCQVYLLWKRLLKLVQSLYCKKRKTKDVLPFFAGIDNCRFKRQVTPGDTLRLEVEITRLRGPIGKGKAIATVDGEIACETEITFALGPVVS